ncbi:MAG TPA: ankyrin repeat domain-containing protein [Vicinamibacterales bacterium]|nr:ankyrin repeat domain-containing protein [Vicinamibacterales bacterium]
MTDAIVLTLLLFGTPLVEAVKQHDAAAVRDLLEKRADVNAPEGDGATALHWAVYGDDPAVVDLLIGAGAKVNAANDLAITPLHLAGANGNAAIITRLLDQGANPNAKSEAGVTPLMEAARSGSVDAVRALIARGADVNARERGRGQTALMWAVARRHPNVVKVLLDHRADVQARTRVRPLTVMLDQGPRRTVKTSMQDARQIEAGGSTALVFAAEANDAESAQHLLAAGANVNDTAADGNTALVRAAFAGHPAVARVLIQAGADVNAAGAGYSALHAAALRGDLATVNALLVHGANPNVQLTRGSPVRRFGSQWALPTPMTGATPLLVAATYLEVDIIRALLQARADHRLGLVNGGTTPLLAAAGIAVEKEARPSDLTRWHIVDSDSPVVPRDEADVFAATMLLLDAGADVNQTNASGDTALHAAAAAGMTTVIQLLAERGAALDAKNTMGQTPLALTMPRERQDGRPQAASGHPAAEELLRKLGAPQ